MATKSCGGVLMYMYVRLRALLMDARAMPLETEKEAICKAAVHRASISLVELSGNWLGYGRAHLGLPSSVRLVRLGEEGHRCSPSLRLCSTMVLYLIPKLLCYILIYFAIQITLFASITGGDHAEASNADIWDEIFNLRNDEEWRALWHVERHRRCFQELENHMKWVCDKDIYKVAKKRNGKCNRFNC